MTTILDNIWGDIIISEEALRWIDTEEFQRLHNIKKSGLAYKVFPGATSTMFCHSIGTYHVTRMLLNTIRFYQPEIISELGDQKCEWVCLAGLLHEIGQGPFSHVFDDYLHLIGISGEWSTHESRTCDIIKMMNQKYNISLNEEGIEFICSLLLPPCEDGSKWYSYIIHNPTECIDTVKMDQLVRDNFQFGLSMTIDVKHIINSCRVIDNTLCFSNKVQDELWNLFIIQHKLQSSIYKHPRITKFEKEVQCMLILMQDQENFKKIVIEKDFVSFFKLTDYYIINNADPVKRKEFHTRTSKLIIPTTHSFHIDYDEFYSPTGL